MVSPAFAVSGTVVSDDGVASPGEAFGLQIVLTNAPGNVELVSGRLATTPCGGATITLDQADFLFGEGGTVAVNFTPYQLVLDSELFHGDKVYFNLFLQDSFNRFADTLEVTLNVGYEARGRIGDHNSGLINFTVSDFGQYGFAPGSIYNLDGEGFRFGGDPGNLLYEAGIILGRNSLQFSSAVRDESGLFGPSDFSPTDELTEGWIDSQQGWHRNARFVDIYSEIPIPVTVNQESVDFGSAGDGGFIILKYFIVNNSVEKLTSLYLGFMADFDLSLNGDTIAYDENFNLVYQTGSSGQITGLVGLKNIVSFTALKNDPNKTGFDNTTLFELISSEAVNVDTGLTGDLMFIAASGGFTLMAFDSVEVAFALVAGENLDELYANTQRARQHYDVLTGVEEIHSSIPSGFALYQNYPNPFNPSTTISFTIPEAADVSCEVYNVIGQRVRRLHSGCLSAGAYTIQWDATDEFGEKVASGLYFYRLSCDAFSQSRKMVLLK